MKLTFKSKTGEAIKSIEDWGKYAPPQKPKQWQDERSAKEFAKYALSDKFGPMIKEILTACNLQQESEFSCTPEMETNFSEWNMGKGRGRNHDLLMKGKNCVIGIEAKVSESFDDIVKNWIEADKENENKQTRINAFEKFLYGEYKPENFENLRYQLITATVGTIIEAKKLDAKNAIMLVLVFKGNVKKEPNYDNNLKNNEEDFKAFCKSLNLPEKGGKVIINDINCWILKKEIEI